MNGVCDKTSNNKYFNCPPRMSDGRHFTDYRPNGYVNDLVRYSNNTMNSYQYRQFLINNTDNLMQINNNYIHQKNGCEPCNAKPIGFETNCVTNQSTSTCYVDDRNGLGLKNSTQFLQPETYNPGKQVSYNTTGFQPHPAKELGYVNYKPLY